MFCSDEFVKKVNVANCGDHKMSVEHMVLNLLAISTDGDRVIVRISIKYRYVISGINNSSIGSLDVNLTNSTR